MLTLLITLELDLTTLLPAARVEEDLILWDSLSNCSNRAATGKKGILGKIPREAERQVSTTKTTLELDFSLFFACVETYSNITRSNLAQINQDFFSTK
jgi:hypothetical protein